MFGKMMNEFWAKVHWVLTFIFFNLVFFPQHYVGEAGMPRRYSGYSENYWLNDLLGINVFISYAAFALGASQLIFLLNFFGSWIFGKKAESNPWESNTLEWTTPSPIPYYNYEKIPTVYRNPYEYSSGEASGGKDWFPQDEPPQEK